MLPIFVDTVSSLLGGLAREVFFIGFFAAALVALAFHRHLFVRRTAVALFLVALLAVNLVGVTALPLTHLHLYSSDVPDQHTTYQLYLVDSAGDELRYDLAAAEPGGIRLRKVFERMATEFSPERNREIATFLLHNAREYRRDIASDRIRVGDRLDVPPHELSFQWTERRLAKHSRFVGIRIYRVRLEYSAGDAGLSVQKTPVLSICPKSNGTCPPAPATAGGNV